MQALNDFNTTLESSIILSHYFRFLLKSDYEFKEKAGDLTDEIKNKQYI